MFIILIIITLAVSSYDKASRGMQLFLHGLMDQFSEGLRNGKPELRLSEVSTGGCTAKTPRKALLLPHKNWLQKETLGNPCLRPLPMLY